MNLRDDLKSSFKKLGKYGTGLRSTVKSVNESLSDDEKVYCAVSGNIDKKSFGLIVLTGQRIVFARKLLTVLESRSFSLDSITSVGTNGTPFLSTLVITFAGGRTEFTNVPSKLGREFVTAANEAMRLMRTTESVGSVSLNIDDAAGRLLKLKQLLDAGVLTQGEYEAKASVLKSAL